MPTFYLGQRQAADLLIQQDGEFGGACQAQAIYEVITVEGKVAWAVIEYFEGGTQVGSVQVHYLDDIGLAMNSYVTHSIKLWDKDHGQLCDAGSLQRFVDARTAVTSFLSAKFPHDEIAPVLTFWDMEHEVQWWATWLDEQGNIRRTELLDAISKAKEV